MSDGNALLEAIRMHPTELTPKLLYLDWAQENPDAIRAQIQSAVDVLPLLCINGVGGGDKQRGESSEARQERFALGQRQLLFAHRDFAASMAWLASKGKRKTVDRSSYGYKHDVEEFWRSAGRSIHVANGAFIAAVICGGFTWEHNAYHASLNVAVGISRRPLKPRKGS